MHCAFVQEQKSIAIGGQHPGGRGEGRGGAWRDYNLIEKDVGAQAGGGAN